MRRREFRALVTDLLEQSFREARNRIEDPVGRARLQVLGDEVFRDLRWEFDLCDRPPPRTRRGALEDHFADVVSAELPLPGAGAIAYNRRTFARDLDIGRLEGHVTVLVPTRSSGRRIGSNLDHLVADLGAFPPDHAFEIMLCVNNSDDDTIDEVRKFVCNQPEIHIDVIEIQQDERISSKRIPTNVLYGLYRERWESLEAEARRAGNDRVEFYLHHHDDDITFHERGGSGIFKNVQEIRRFHRLELTSGIYSTSGPRQGFAFVNTVRKRRELLAHVPPCLQIYGGAATQTSRSFPADGIPPDARGFDAYMSSYLVTDDIPTDLAHLNVYTMAARTNRHLLVEHPEETSVLRFLYRLCRDWDYGERWKARRRGTDHSARMEIYQPARRATHRSINKLIEGLVPSNEYFVGFTWYTCIRDLAKQLYKKETLTAAAIREHIPCLTPGVDPVAEYRRRGETMPPHMSS